MHDDPEQFERASRLASNFPGIEVSTSYGRPALKVKGKFLAANSREAGALVVFCPIPLKEHLMESRPDLYFETDHYRGWPAVLVRMDAIDDEALQARLESAWLERAPKQVAKRWIEREAEDGKA
jgi:hypothetical protein